MINDVLLNLLANKRISEGLTQEGLAELSSISISDIQKIESGHPTSLSVAKKIAHSLKLTSHEVLIQDNNGLPNKTIKQHSKAKNLILKYKAPLILGFALLNILFLTNNKLTEYSFIAFTFVFLIPHLTILVLTKEDKFKKRDHSRYHPPKLLFYSVLFVSLLILNLSTAFFSLNFINNTAEFIHIKKDFLLLLSSPNNHSIEQWVFYNNYFLWISSGFIAVISIFSIHYLINKKDLNFGVFSKTYYIVALISLTLFPLLSEARQSQYGLYYTPSFIVLAIAFISSVIYLKSQGNTATKKEQYINFYAGIILCLIPALINSSFSSFILSTNKNIITTGFSGTLKIDYCQKNKTPLCWDVELLKRNGMPLDSDNIHLISAKNGNFFAIKNVFENLEFVADEDSELPYFSENKINFLTESYIRSLEYKKEKGLLKDFIILYLGDEGSFEFNPDDNIRWAKMAMTNREKFAEEFKHSELSVRNDATLDAIYSMITGDWSVRNIKGVKLYSGGYVSFTIEDDEFVGSGTISDSDINKVDRINLGFFPNFN